MKGAETWCVWWGAWLLKWEEFLCGDLNVDTDARRLYVIFRSGGHVVEICSARWPEVCATVLRMRDRTTKRIESVKSGQSRADDEDQ